MAWVNDMSESFAEERVERAAAGMHRARRELARTNGDIEFDVEFDALPDHLKEVDRALARAAILAAAEPVQVFPRGPLSYAQMNHCMALFSNLLGTPEAARRAIESAAACAYTNGFQDGKYCNG